MQNLQVVALHQFSNMLTAMVEFFDDHIKRVANWELYSDSEEGCGALFNYMVFLVDNTLQPPHTWSRLQVLEGHSVKFVPQVFDFMAIFAFD